MKLAVDECICHICVSLLVAFVYVICLLLINVFTHIWLTSAEKENFVFTKKKKKTNKSIKSYTWVFFEIICQKKIKSFIIFLWFWFVTTKKIYIKLDSFNKVLGKIPEDSTMDVDHFDATSMDISSVDFQQTNDENLSVHQR